MIFKTVQGKIAFQKLYSILWSLKININTKIQLCHTFMEAITTYRVTSGQLTKKIESQEKAAESDFIHRSCQIYTLEHIRNNTSGKKAHV